MVLKIEKTEIYWIVCLWSFDQTRDFFSFAYTAKPQAINSVEREEKKSADDLKRRFPIFVRRTLFLHLEKNFAHSL